MGQLTDAGHLATWSKVHARLLLVLLVLAVCGVVVSPFRISARTQELSGPSFSTAILLPCLGATFVLYLSLPFQRTLEQLSARPMGVWRVAQGVASVVVGLALIAPAAVAAQGDTGRIFQNTGIFSAASIVVGRLIHPVAGVVLPWLWALGALLFGLRSAELGQQRWAWWSWIVGPQVHAWLGIGVALLGTVACLWHPRAEMPSRG